MHQISLCGFVSVSHIHTLSVPVFHSFTSKIYMSYHLIYQPYFDGTSVYSAVVALVDFHKDPKFVSAKLEQFIRSPSFSTCFLTFYLD